ncbi:kinase super protein [Cymbomonas tetramitiformis]|uniref:Kinase super protein n=1 Tax=Cymbomonas tetramitiformis TaxID=36881 RepID=A0AAE0LFL3_9CHLO|nr:kinase super protein [Cymbomonas tetramitiformis]
MEDLGPEWIHTNQLGQGAFGSVHLFLHAPSNMQFAVKFIDRGHAISETVHREIVNHRSLQHNNITRFKQLILTPSKLAIVMEYAGGGDLFTYVTRSPQKRLVESVARFFFQQLVSGLDYMQSQGVCHRDIKLENTLISGNPPTLKLCDFGYSKSQRWQSDPHSQVGTAAYIAPEVLCGRGNHYNAQAVDVWSCGVLLHVMLVGTYPFCDPSCPNNEQRTMWMIGEFWQGRVQYKPPGHVSPECADVLKRILYAQPQGRITLGEIQDLAWFRTNLPAEFDNRAAGRAPVVPIFPQQSQEDLEVILEQATGQGMPQAQPRQGAGAAEGPEITMGNSFDSIQGLTPGQSFE